ncbi:MAG: glycosyltransferase family 4 protein [Sedimentisphaerales bacterium]|nr:glycosyltransferase family 4 protein [Sedimentisphaerales bacterium]
MADKQMTTESEAKAPKQPKVALIATRRIVTNYSLYLKHLLAGLADESVPALLVCPPGLDVDSIVPPAVEVVRHPAIDIPFLERHNRNLLLNRLAGFRPDLLHCLCETNAALVRWLARRLDLNYILNINSIIPRFQYIPISTARCAAVIAPARTIAEHLAVAHPKLSDRIRQINIGTFVANATACFSHTDRLPGIVVAYPPDDHSEIDNLFKSFHRLAIENYEFMVALVGAGRDEKQLRKKLRATGLLRIVTLVPRLPGFESAMSAADIFIVPRPSQSFNSLLLSAMSAGSAVAACKGGVDDPIMENKTAMTFNPDDQLSIYNCLRRLFDSRELSRQVAADAQDHLRSNYLVSVMVSSTLALYRQAARPPQPQTESFAA